MGICIREERAVGKTDREKEGKSKQRPTKEVRMKVISNQGGKQRKTERREQTIEGQ